MKFARGVFRIAGLFGVLALTPLYFLERELTREQPPAITHPEYYYGFLGVALAWQFAFLVIATDPARYRQLMLAGVLEKFSFALASITLVVLGRTPLIVLAAGTIDFAWGVLFLLAYRVTSPSRVDPARFSD